MIPSALSLIQYEDSGIGVVMFLIILALGIVVLIGAWKVFEKAGKPGWGCLVPIYNIILLLEIVGRPVWWVVLCLIPFVNVIVSIILSLDLARKFGQGTGFGLGIFFFGFIFVPILGFGDARYQAGA
ncbi:MAG: DUF5684 domain-containing protein [Ignavibacteria bacterium]|nr:DUF5684 domain-containing protein [Ignavibacteria bacterium]